MTHSKRLYALEPGFAEVPLGLHMIAGLTGFTDAGSTLGQLADQIFANFTTKLVVRFKNDELLDYRSRRPVMFFERDHIEDYEPATLGIYLVHDEANQPFLYLHGYEPDLRWEEFSESILELVADLAVADFTWVHAIPFPIPHTREVGIAVSGNRKDIIDAVSEWKPQTQVPGNILHLLEYRLSKKRLPTIGFVMLVPHYLSESEYPDSALMALEQMASATGLVFPTDAIREDGLEFHRKLVKQIEKNEDLQKLVASLEQGYSKDLSGLTRSPIAKPKSKLPNAEEIAAELEDYLAIRRKNSADEGFTN
ncbi:unannotated protein [freshwater metagenome]|uniref:Unannotated protein n=1 Tax=freshwater metagenome TaxID=449393 RepID=A0A6J6J2Z2_9ZZZZ|nr:PAC2 family protein [Actinomycetota bacterium]